MIKKKSKNLFYVWINKNYYQQKKLLLLGLKLVSLINSHKAKEIKK